MDTSMSGQSLAFGMNFMGFKTFWRKSQKWHILFCTAVFLDSLHDSFVSDKILAGEQPTPPWSDGSQLNMKMARENPRVGTENGSIMDSSFPR